MFTRFEEQWHCCGGGARLGGAMQTFLCLGFHSLRKNEETLRERKEGGKMKRLTDED